MDDKYIIKALLMSLAIMLVLNFGIPENVMRFKWKVVMNVAAGLLTLYWVLKVI